MSQPIRIAIFDSGLGGLTVVRALRSLLSTTEIFYLGDTARLPYGTKSPETISRYLHQNVHYLKSFDPQAIIIACNSASSVLNPEEFGDLPVIGMIEAGAQSAFEVTKNKKVGVIGTRTTISSKCYVQALEKLDPNIEVFQQSCPLFVPLVEEGWTEDPLTNLVVYRYLSQLTQAGIDTLILGCTHYPLLQKAIEQVCGPEIQLVNPAGYLFNQLSQKIPDLKISSQSQPLQPIQIMCTDTAIHFKIQAQAILGPEIQIDFTRIDL